MTNRGFLTTFVVGLIRLVTGANARWLGEPPTEEQTVYFANHTSNLDFPVLWASLPEPIRERVRPVAAADYWASGVRGRFACDIFHAILVNRHGKPDHDPTPEERATHRLQVVQALLDALDAGSSLIIFPEGTRGDGREVATFRGGLHTLCVERPGLRIVPVYLENLSRMLPKGEVLPIPLICRVTFGDATELHPGEEKADFLARTRSALSALRDL